jgi:hypothetical protein
MNPDVLTETRGMSAPPTLLEAVFVSSPQQQWYARLNGSPCHSSAANEASSVGSTFEQMMMVKDRKYSGSVFNSSAGSYDDQ